MSLTEGTGVYPYPASADRRLGEATTDLMNTSRDPVTRLSQSGPRSITTVPSNQIVSYLAIHLANDKTSAYQVPEQSYTIQECLYPRHFLWVSQMSMRKYYDN
jgi:hypothetical protein